MLILEIMKETSKLWFPLASVLHIVGGLAPGWGQEDLILGKTWTLVVPGVRTPFENRAYLRWAGPRGYVWTWGA